MLGYIGLRLVFCDTVSSQTLEGPERYHRPLNLALRYNINLIAPYVACTRVLSPLSVDVFGFLLVRNVRERSVRTVFGAESMPPRSVATAINVLITLSDDLGSSNLL